MSADRCSYCGLHRITHPCLEACPHGFQEGDAMSAADDWGHIECALNPQGAAARIEELERFKAAVIREYNQQVSVIFPSIEVAMREDTP